MLISMIVILIPEGYHALICKQKIGKPLIEKHEGSKTLRFSRKKNGNSRNKEFYVLHLRNTGINGNTLQ